MLYEIIIILIIFYLYYTIRGENLINSTYTLSKNLPVATEAMKGNKKQSQDAAPSDAAPSDGAPATKSAGPSDDSEAPTGNFADDTPDNVDLPKSGAYNLSAAKSPQQYNLYWPDSAAARADQRAYACGEPMSQPQAYPLPGDFVKHPVFTGIVVAPTGVSMKAESFQGKMGPSRAKYPIKEGFGAHGPRTLMPDNFPDHDLARCGLSQCQDDLSIYASANGWGSADDILQEQRDERNAALEQVSRRELMAEDFVNTRQCMGASRLPLQKGSSYLPQQWANTVCESDCPAYNIIGARADSARNLSTAALNSLYTQTGWVAEQPASCDTVGWDTSPNTAIDGVDQGGREYRGSQGYIFKEWSAI